MIKFPEKTLHNLNIITTTGKGGVGKSTTAINLAMSTKNGYLALTDPMANFENIIANRKKLVEEYDLKERSFEQVIYTNTKNNVIDNLELTFEKVLKIVDDPKGSDVNLFIDLYGFEMTTQQRVFELSDLILLPTSYGEIEYQSLRVTSKMLKRISKDIGRELSAVLFLNKISSRKTINSISEHQKLLEVVDELDNIIFIDTHLNNLEGFLIAINNGCSVFELPKTKYKKVAKQTEKLIKTLGLPFAFEKKQKKGEIKNGK